MRKIAVVGSINIDYFVETDQFPETGETLLANNFFLSLGGKGANQAVAASRLGGNVSLFGSVGSDENSKVIMEKMQQEKVDIGKLNFVENSPTGAAFIELCNSENRILVVPGANKFTDVSYMKTIIDELLQHDVIVFQLETPIEIIEYVVPLLHEQGKITILNPAPAKKLSPNVIENITYLTPNEHEFQIIFDSHESMETLLKQYANKLLITCGEAGVAYFDDEKVVQVPAIKVEPVDTTGAGDTFSGAFSVAIAEGRSLKEAIQFGIVAAGLSITKKGAQTGMPLREEVELRLEKEADHEFKGPYNKTS
jgi:ribokinase